MSDESRPDSTPPQDEFPTASQTARRRRGRIAWIWLIPVVAVVAAFSLVLHRWYQGGPEIQIVFKTASGLVAGKTEIRDKDVVVGTVNTIRLSEDRKTVIVTADLTKSAAGLAAKGTSFWVVGPRFSLSGISGLGTLLSGGYIGVDAPPPKAGEEVQSQSHFVGLDNPPEVTYDRQGRRFVLRASDLGSLDIGSPVYYRRINVGQVIGYQLDASGKYVNIQIFVDAPNDRFVTDTTKFWNASGFDVSLGTNGLRVRTESLVSAAIGGVAFENIADDSTTQPANADQSFALYSDKAAAETVQDKLVFPIRMRFDQSIRGLAVGAPLDFHGITIGNITGIKLDFDRKTKQFFVVVSADIYPLRLGPVYKTMTELPGKTDQDRQNYILGFMIKGGMRAQLRTGNLLTGQLYVALDTFPNAKPVNYTPSSPQWIPTTAGNFDQLQQQVTTILDKVSKVPFESIGNNLNSTLAQSAALMKRMNTEIAPEAKQTLIQTNQTLRSLQTSLGPNSDLSVQLQDTMGQVNRAVAALRSLAEFLTANPQTLLWGRGKDPQVGK